MLTSLGEVLPQAAKKFGDKVALVFEGENFTFNELNNLSDQLAAGLVAIGIQPGDRITLYSSNSWEWIVSYYGVLKTGAIINPLNVMLTAREAEYAVKDLSLIHISEPTRRTPISY